MGRRTVLLIAALVLAAVGTIAVYLYAQNARKDGDAAAALVNVLVAKSQIEVGTTGAAAQTNGAVAVTQVRAADVVPGALSSVTPISTLVATVQIFPGQQIIAQQFAATASTTGLSIPPGKIAISVQLGDPQRVAGFVAPGSTIAIFVTGSSVAPGAGGAGQAGASSRVLLAPVPVIAVGPATVVSKTSSDGTNANTEQIPTAILTLAVTQEEAEKIILVANNVPNSQYSGLYFGLMTDKSKVTPRGPGATNSTLFR